MKRWLEYFLQNGININGEGSTKETQLHLDLGNGKLFENVSRWISSTVLGSLIFFFFFQKFCSSFEFIYLSLLYSANESNANFLFHSDDEKMIEDGGNDELLLYAAENGKV